MPDKFFLDSSRKEVDHKRILLVEGKDDAYFFEKLLQLKSANPEDVAIIATGGKTELKKSLIQLMKQSPFVRGNVLCLAIVQDADQSGANTLGNIQNDLQSVALPAPPHGVFQNGPLSVGIFVLPSASEEGDLEKVCLETVATKPRLHLTKQFFEQIQSRFGTLDRSHKRLAAIYLACSMEETKGVGRAFQKTTVFDCHHHCLNDINSFLDAFLQ